jgi:hypothetical protein
VVFLRVGEQRGIVGQYGIDVDAISSETRADKSCHEIHTVHVGPRLGKQHGNRHVVVRHRSGIRRAAAVARVRARDVWVDTSGDQQTSATFQPCFGRMLKGFCDNFGRRLMAVGQKTPPWPTITVAEPEVEQQSRNSVSSRAMSPTPRL